MSLVCQDRIKAALVCQATSLSKWQLLMLPSYVTFGWLSGRTGHPSCSLGWLQRPADSTREAWWCGGDEGEAGRGGDGADPVSALRRPVGDDRCVKARPVPSVPRSGPRRPRLVYSQLTDRSRPCPSCAREDQPRSRDVWHRRD